MAVTAFGDVGNPPEVLRGPYDVLLRTVTGTGASSYLIINLTALFAKLRS